MQPKCPLLSQKLHRFRGLLLLGVVLSSLAGCDSDQPIVPHETESPFADRTLRIACPDPDIAELIASFGRVWAANSGAKSVEVVGPSEDQLEVDAWIIRPAELARFAEDGHLAEVPSDLTHPDHPYEWAGLLPIYREKLLTWNNTPVALPIVGDGRILVTKRATEANPPVPATWAEVTEFGSFGPLPDSAEDLTRAFFTVAAPLDRPEIQKSALTDAVTQGGRASELFSFHYDLLTLRPRLDEPAFVHALTWFRESARAATLAEADAAVVSLNELAQLQASHPDQFVVAPVPGSDFYFDHATGERRPAPSGVNRIPYIAGGWLGAVRKGGPNAAAAFDLFAYLSMPRGAGSEIISSARWGAGPYRSVHLGVDHQSLWYGYRLDPTQTQNLIDALRTYQPASLGNPVVGLRIPTAPEHLDAIAPILREGIASDTNPAEVMAQAVAAWNQLDGAISKDELGRRYRLSLNLGE